MHDRFFERMEAGLAKLQASAECGRLKDEATAHQRLVRLKESVVGGACGQCFQCEDRADLPAHRKGPAECHIESQPAVGRLEGDFRGCYLLRTNLTDLDPAMLWKRYIQLTEAEWAFRITKDELEIRPIWHQREERVLAHILVCFLAYVLWKTLAQWMRRAGLGDAPRTLVEEFAKIKSGDPPRRIYYVVLPARMADGSQRTIHLRCVTTPDESQKVLLNRLGLTLPQRLRTINEVEQM